MRAYWDHDEMTIGDIEEEERWKEHTAKRMAEDRRQLDEMGCIVSMPEDFKRMNDQHEYLDMIDRKDRSG